MQQQHAQEMNTKQSSYLSELRKISDMQDRILQSVERFTPAAASTSNGGIASRIATVSAPPPTIIQMGMGGDPQNRQERSKSRAKRRVDSESEDTEDQESQKTKKKKKKKSKRKQSTEESDDDSEIQEKNAPTTNKKGSNSTDTKAAAGKKKDLKPTDKKSLKSIKELETDKEEDENKTEREESDSEPAKAKNPESGVKDKFKLQPVKAGELSEIPEDKQDSKSAVKPEEKETPKPKALNKTELNPSKYSPDEDDILIRICRCTCLPDSVNVVKLLVFLFDADGKQYGSPDGISVLCDFTGSIRQPSFKTNIKIQRNEVKAIKSLFAYLVLLTVDELGYLKSGEKQLSPCVVAVSILPIFVDEKENTIITDADAKVW